MWCTSSAQFTNSNIEHIWKDSQLIHTENIYALLGGFWHGRFFSGTGGEAKFVWCAWHTWSLILKDLSGCNKQFFPSLFTGNCVFLWGVGFLLLPTGRLETILGLHSSTGTNSWADLVWKPCCLTVRCGPKFWHLGPSDFSDSFRFRETKEIHTISSKSPYLYKSDFSQGFQVTRWWGGDEGTGRGIDVKKWEECLVAGFENLSGLKADDLVFVCFGQIKWLSPNQLCDGKQGFPAEEEGGLLCYVLETGQPWFFQSIDFGRTTLQFQAPGCYWDWLLETLLVSGVRGGHNQSTLVLPHGTSAGKCHWHGVISMDCLWWLLSTANLNPALICNCQTCACIVEADGRPAFLPAVYWCFLSRSGGLTFQCEVVQACCRHQRAKISLHLSPSLDASLTSFWYTFLFWFLQALLHGKKLNSHRFGFK